MPEHPTDAHFLFTFVFKQALKIEKITFIRIPKDDYLYFSTNVNPLPVLYFEMTIYMQSVF